MAGQKGVPAFFKQNPLFELTSANKMSLMPKFLQNSFVISQFYLNYLSSSKNTRYFLFLSEVNIRNVKLLRHIIDLIIQKVIYLELFITKGAIQQIEQLKQEGGNQKIIHLVGYIVESVLRRQKDVILSNTMLKNKETPQTTIDIPDKLPVYQTFDNKALKDKLYQLLEIQQQNDAFFKYFDKHLNLYNNKQDPTSFQNKQLKLFNSLILSQPEQTQLGVRNCFYYLKVEKLNNQINVNQNIQDSHENDQEDSKNEEKSDQKIEQKITIIKNPTPPQLIVVPLSSTDPHAEQVVSFANNVNMVLANKLVQKFSHVKFVFTVQPVENENILKQIRKQTKQLDKIYVSRDIVQLRDDDFEVIVKSANFCIVGPNIDIIQQINAFGQFCLCLDVDGKLNNELKEQINDANNIIIDNAEQYDTVYQFITNNEESIKEKHSPAPNDWF